MGTDTSMDAQAEQAAKDAEGIKKAAEAAAKIPDQPKTAEGQAALQAVQANETDLAAHREALAAAGVTPEAAKAAARESLAAVPEAKPDTQKPDTATASTEEGKSKPESSETPSDTSAWGELKDYFSKMEASGAPWYSALFSTVGYGVEMLWNKLFGGEKQDDKKKDAKGPQASIEPVSGSASPKDLEAAKDLLKAVMEDSGKKQWAVWAKEIETSDKPKYGGVPASTILAFINTESRFNAQAGSPTGALGLGQFVPGTWSKFQAENPEFAGAEATDPHASLCAIAWYCKSNAAELGLDAKDPQEAGLLYMAHFAGAAGFAHIQDSFAGKPVDLPPPGAYGDPKQPAFYCKDYAAYAQLGKRLGATVQAVADSYAETLNPAGQPNV